MRIKKGSLSFLFSFSCNFSIRKGKILSAEYSSLCAFCCSPFYCFVKFRIASGKLREKTFLKA